MSLLDVPRASWALHARAPPKPRDDATRVHDELELAPPAATAQVRCVGRSSSVLEDGDHRDAPGGLGGGPYLGPIL